MKIRMLYAHRGSEDGFIVREYHKEQEYDVTGMLGMYFIRVGVAVGIIPENIDESKAESEAAHA